MDLSDFLLVVFGALSLGVASHISYFIHGEHHLHSARILGIFVTAPLLLFAGILRFAEFSTAAQIAAIATTSYFSALATSILAYRVFFHPLHYFPGPFTAKLSKWQHAIRVSRKLDNYFQTYELHQKYGDIVRIGPNELSVIVPEAVPLITGVGSKCVKSAWYDSVGLPHASLHATRDREEHDRRRKVWDRAFNAKALRDYEVRVNEHADKLVSELTKLSGMAVNATLWVYLFAFDVMGDLSFGKSFDLLKTGKMHYALELLREGMAPVGWLSPVSWVFPIMHTIPGAGAGYKAFVKYCDDQIAIRREKEPEKRDIMSWLISAENYVEDPRSLNGDSRLIIGAGSETTAATLTHIFYYLIRDPILMSKLDAELQSLGYPTEAKDLQDAKYLNGVINESLRLHPPVPGGVFRQTPPEGITIGSTFVPGDVNVSAPTWTMGRLESCYSNAEGFMPERWGDNPELLKDKTPFVPFSSGVYSCVGKHLALMEIRAVVARIIKHFEVTFAPGEDGTNLLTKTKDVFTLEMAPLMLVYTKREAR